MFHHRFIFLVTLLIAINSTNYASALPYKPGELLIKFHDDTSSVSLKAAGKPSYHGNQQWQRITLNSDEEVSEALAYYGKQPWVKYAEPNYIIRKAETIPNDPSFALQWALSNTHLDMPRAWDYTTGSRDVVIAVIDTGIDYHHIDLKNNIWVNPDPNRDYVYATDHHGNPLTLSDDQHGACFESNYEVRLDFPNHGCGAEATGNPRDDDTNEWHGTHVAGIAGAVGHNGEGVTGINWHVSLMGVKVLHCPVVSNNGESVIDCDSADGTLIDLIRGIDYAINNGAHIINLSLAMPGKSQALSEALYRADKAGVLVVSAAGNASNNNDTAPVSPASIRSPNHLTVAALTHDFLLANYSNYGRTSVDLAAPGGVKSGTNAILSTVSSDDQFDYRWGTSMAAPHVAGLAALLWSINTELTHHQIKAKILNGVDRRATLEHRTISGGTLQASNAISQQSNHPAIFRIEPAEARQGETIRITGVNFGFAGGTVTVEGHDVVLPPASIWTDSVIEVSIPAGLPGGYIRLQVNNKGSSHPFLCNNCKISLTATPSTGVAPLESQLSVDIAIDEDMIESIEWDFGSGFFSYNSKKANIVHEFKTGDFHVRVRITYADGSQAITNTKVRANQSNQTDSKENVDSRCFIATAAWGSPLHDDVLVLRQFRDHYLRNSHLGNILIEGYYHVSPPIADIIRQQEWARWIIRQALKPLITVAKWVVPAADAASLLPSSITHPTSYSEYLIGFQPGTSQQIVEQIVQQHRGELRSYDAHLHYAVVYFDAYTDTKNLGEQLKQHPEVSYLELNASIGKP